MTFAIKCDHYTSDFDFDSIELAAVVVNELERMRRRGETYGSCPLDHEVITPSGHPVLSQTRKG